MYTNILVGLLVMALCLIIQCVVAEILILWRRVQSRKSISKHRFLSISITLSVSMLVLMAGNLLQVCLWAWVFVLQGEIGNFQTAFYHSLVNFTTLGYGDIVMSQSHRLLGALEAANGVMMFGLTTSVMVSIINSIVRRAKAE